MILLKCEPDHVASLLQTLQWSHSMQNKCPSPYSVHQAYVISPFSLDLWLHLWLFHSLILLQTHRPLYYSLKTPCMPLPQDICIYYSVCQTNFLLVWAQMSFCVWNLLWPPYLKQQQHSHTHCVKHTFYFLHFWCFDLWSPAEPGGTAPLRVSRS